MKTRMIKVYYFYYLVEYRKYKTEGIYLLNSSDMVLIYYNNLF